MPATNWPTATQYVTAVQRPSDVFTDPGLRTTRLDLLADGTPDSVEGRNAVVFFGAAGDGARIVIRCLKRPLPHAAERYAKLHDYLGSRGVPAVAEASWVDPGILVANEWRPVIRMEDVGGKPLRRYLENHLDRPEILAALADRWLALVDLMGSQRLAHGDFQPDNIRVLADGQLRLVDLDGVWAPPLAHLPPAEAGHVDFQHPERLHTAHWGPTIDLFSSVVVQLSVLALATDPGLWAHHNAENLILTGADYRNPMGTAVWHRLAGNRDTRVRQLLAVLQQLCRLSVTTDLSPAQVLRDRCLPNAELPTIIADPEHAWWGTEAPATPPPPPWGEAPAPAVPVPPPVPPPAAPPPIVPAPAERGRAASVAVAIALLVFLLILMITVLALVGK